MNTAKQFRDNFPVQDERPKLRLDTFEQVVSTVARENDVILTTNIGNMWLVCLTAEGTMLYKLLSSGRG